MQTTYQEIPEEQYRNYFQIQDRSQASLVVRVVMWAMLPLSFIDILFHQFSFATAILLSMRAVTIALSWWFLRKIKKLGTAPVVDQYLLRWIVMVMVLQLINNCCTPRDYYGHYLIDIWGCLMTFIVVPLPLPQLRLPVVGFVVGSLVLLAFKQAPYYGYSLGVAMMLPASAVTGHAIASYVHRYRRKLLSAERELDRQASIDPVTGVANWREFMRLADAELQRHKRLTKPMSMLVLDVADFKKINDEYGPETADIILVEVTRRIKRVMRSYDSLARYGSDEFCVLLPEAAANDAEKIAGRTQTTVVSMPITVAGKEIKIDATIGVATMNEGDNVSALLHRAGNARGKGKITNFLVA
ncbi:GGDEF domain-containing protein [Undibacterium sp. SXout20W]|uniref:GGDEF domain-containing protein n=1 Tax=Undibacterium sp. SXout20W TaxID=3413051 RepID=UPI003BF3AEF7